MNLSWKHIAALLIIAVLLATLTAQVLGYSIDIEASLERFRFSSTAGQKAQ